MNVKQLADQQLVDRVKLELDVWGNDLNFDDLRVLDFSLNKVKFFGIQREPIDFMEQACKVQHPMNPSLALPEVLAEAISFTAQKGFHQVAKRRVEFFKHWNKRALELEQAEIELRREMDPLVEKAVQGKKLKLFGEMLEHYQYPDVCVLDGLRFLERT